MGRKAEPRVVADAMLVWRERRVEISLAGINGPDYEGYQLSNSCGAKTDGIRFPLSQKIIIFLSNANQFSL